MSRKNTISVLNQVAVATAVAGLISVSLTQKFLENLGSMADDISYYFSNSPFTAIAVVILIFATTASVVSFIYSKRLFELKSEKSFYDGKPDRSIEINYLEKEISTLRNKLTNYIKSGAEVAPLSDEKLNEAKQAAIQVVIESISSETAREIRAKAHAEAIDSLESKSLARLSDLSVVLGSRANLTLVMGVVFCSLGLVAIYTSFFLSPPEQNASASTAWVDIVRSYTPRFTMVILIELIGFFFLKLYKSTLSDIRYTQNEMTNIEMHLIALHAANTLSAEHTELVLKSFLSTERNSVIDKGQTTVEIEQHRAQSDADRSHLEALAALLHGNEKGSIWRGKS